MPKRGAPGGALDEMDAPEPPRRLSHLWGAYVALTLVMGITVALTVLLDDNTLVDQFAPNVATEALSIVVTVAVIQRLLQREERARKMRAAVGALRKARMALGDFVDSWAILVKGSLDGRRTEYPRTVHQLFAPYYTEELACMDPARVSGGGPDDQRIAACLERLREARPRLREIILTYGATLDAEYLEALDEIVDDPFVAFFTSMGERDGVTAEEWRLKINRSRGLLEVHFVRLDHAVRLHNRLAAEAARFRSKHLAPSAESMSVQLSADRDLAIRTDLPTAWWEAAPPVGSFREAPVSAAARR